MTLLAQNLVLSSDISNLIQIEKLIDSVCDNCHITEDNYGNILIALTEAVNNAIVHGNKEDVSKKVTLTYVVSSNEVCFVVKDEGNGFDLNQVPDPTLPENINKLNGRGVFLMNSLADEVVYEENGSAVSLKFCLTNS
ncbi:ATP-binding protein [Vicingus serpentipes]|uniref:ATP-binding protein n=1 Tax=Vicingus serpentipes TaxID=1926625 RepID=A0A5C6RRX4_9FLAO|nr:ATP-binding protein [Vicingus serpentipes]TXB64759.1 ATP-binding protein [Vicingus serpentipes]